MSTHHESSTNRIEKTAVSTAEGMKYGQLDTEVELMAIDSLPELDKNTVRVEDVTRRDDDHYHITISGVPR